MVAYYHYANEKPSTALAWMRAMEKNLPPTHKGKEFESLVSGHLANALPHATIVSRHVSNEKEFDLCVFRSSDDIRKDRPVMVVECGSSFNAHKALHDASMMNFIYPDATKILVCGRETISQSVRQALKVMDIRLFDLMVNRGTVSRALEREAGLVSKAIGEFDSYLHNIHSLALAA